MFYHVVVLAVSSKKTPFGGVKIMSELSILPGFTLSSSGILFYGIPSK